MKGRTGKPNVNRYHCYWCGCMTNRAFSPSDLSCFMRSWLGTGPSCGHNNWHNHQTVTGGSVLFNYWTCIYWFIHVRQQAAIGKLNAYKLNRYIVFSFMLKPLELLRIIIWSHVFINRVTWQVPQINKWVL